MIGGLIKLGTLALIGYAAYAIYQEIAHRGMATQGQGGGQGGQWAGEEQQRRVGGARMSGRGEGRHEITQDPSGTSVSHRVGRGVI